MESTWKPVRSAGLRRETIGDEYILVDPNSSQAICVNPSAALVWSLCDGDTPPDEIVAIIADAYPQAADKIATDVRQALELLRQNGALK